MTVTQAPTPGPLSVTIGQIDLDRLRSIIHLATHQVLPFADKPMKPFSAKERAGMQVEIADLIINDIGKANAPTAPVEASGSEPVDLLKLDDIAEYLSSVFRINDGNTVIAAAVELDRLRDALRPQPSGETREAVARIVRGVRVGSAFGGTYTEYQGGRLDQIDFDGADAILALLSARPLALGGQHSGGDAARLAAWLRQYPIGTDGLTVKCKANEAADLLERLSTTPARPLALGGQQGVDRGRVEAIVREAVVVASVDVPDKFADRVATRFEITKNATDAIVSALSTTPARAEAQDEGAAGEPVAWGLQFPGKRIRHTFDAESTAQGWADHAGDGAKVVPLYAHPSPPPAADEDRVRIAVEAALPEVMSEDMERVWRGAFIHQGHKRHGRGAVGNSRRVKNPESCEQYAWRALRKHLLAALKSEGK